MQNSKYADSFLTAIAITIGHVLCPISPVDCHSVMADNYSVCSYVNNSVRTISKLLQLDERR